MNLSSRLRLGAIGVIALLVPLCNSQTPTIHATAGDYDPTVIYADQESNKAQLMKAFETARDAKISLSKESKLALGSDKSRYKGWLKSCNDRYYVDVNYTATHYCNVLADELKRSTSLANPDVEAIFFRSCAISPENVGTSCKQLGDFYLARQDYRSALLAFTTDDCANKYCARGEARIYKQFGAAAHLHRVNEELCHSLFDYDACDELRAQGESLDENQWLVEYRKYRREEDREDLRRQRRHDADVAEKQQEKADRNAFIAEMATGLAQTAADSYQQYQAGVAQARVNVAVAQMEQQNKARGGSGYPTSSSSGTSTASTSRPEAKKTPPNSSDKSDSSSSDSSDTGSGSAASSGTQVVTSNIGSGAPPFNPYSAKVSSNLNAYSPDALNRSVPANEAAHGHWVQTEIVVGMANRLLPHSWISVGMVNEKGTPDPNGAFITIANSDLHPIYYGFAGVVNERFGGSTGLVHWPAPYIYKDRPNPPFFCRMTITYWASY